MFERKVATMKMINIPPPPHTKGVSAFYLSEGSSLKSVESLFAALFLFLFFFTEPNNQLGPSISHPSRSKKESLGFSGKSSGIKSGFGDRCTGTGDADNGVSTKNKNTKKMVVT